MSQFLKSLIKVSEKAANIARVCRQDKHLFKLLVQEKNKDEKNPVFVQDFKTLADVLIQETIKHDIGKEYPNIAPHIKGEESNSFSNTLGDTITVAVQDSEAATAALLTQVLNGDTTAGDLLAAEVHKQISIEFDTLNLDCIPNDLELPVNHFGIWIDPIDSTLEYISGTQEPPTLKNIHSKGLQCVTVLIGVFDRRTGEPVLGVVNQPFHVCKGSEWSGQCYWGLSFENKNFYSCHCKMNSASTSQKVVVLSAYESDELKQNLTEKGYCIVEASGAGYKCLAVALGEADAYLMSRGTTYRWDICGPHALLKAQRGGIIQYLPAEEGTIQEISYFESETDEESNGIKQWCNKDGVIAYRNFQFLGEIVHFLKERVVNYFPHFQTVWFLKGDIKKSLKFDETFLFFDDKARSGIPYYVNDVREQLPHEISDSIYCNTVTMGIHDVPLVLDDFSFEISWNTIYSSIKYKIELLASKGFIKFMYPSLYSMYIVERNVKYLGRYPISGQCKILICYNNDVLTRNSWTACAEC